MKKRFSCSAIFLLAFFCLLSDGEIWALSSDQLDQKIKFVEFALNQNAISELGEAISSIEISESFLDEVLLTTFCNRLVAVGHELSKRNLQQLALVAYNKAVELNPRDWLTLSYINEIANNKMILGSNTSALTMNQIRRLMQNFEPAVLFISQTIEVAFWSVLLAILALAIWLIRNYLALATNDMVFNNKGYADKKKLVIWVLLLFWPIFVGAGWFFLVLLIIASLGAYASDDESKCIKYVLILVVLIAVLFSFNRFLVSQMNKMTFIQVKRIAQTPLYDFDMDKLGKNPQARLMLSYNNFHAGQTDKGVKWLNTIDDNFQDPLKDHLYGFVFLMNKDYGNAIKKLSDIATYDPSATTLYNLTLALVNSNDKKIYEAYLDRFPQIQNYVDRINHPHLPLISEKFLWHQLMSDGKKKDVSTLVFVLQSCLNNFIRLPFVYYIIIVLLYLKFLPIIFGQIGKSTFCSKCHNVIEKDKAHRAFNVCSDCYQLFLIKDSMMVDAKQIKEGEIMKRTRKRNLLVLLLSLIFPGFFLHMRDQHRFFITLDIIYFFFIFMAFFAEKQMFYYYGTALLLMKFMGLFAVLIYVAANTLIFKGDEYGV